MDAASRPFFLPAAEAHASGLVSVGKPLKINVEFSLVEPQGGIHFVVPENTLKDVTDADAEAKKNVTLADRAAHLFSVSQENSSR